MLRVRVYAHSCRNMATLRGPQRYGEVDTHIAVSGYDESQNGDDRRHGGLFDDGKRKKPRGIGKSIQNFFLVKLRYDPTIAIILLMVVAAIALIACGLYYLPLITDPDVALIRSAKKRVTAGVEGYDGEEGLVEPELPDELTSEDLPNAKNGDSRFTFNDRIWAMTVDGAAYVADEDIVHDPSTGTRTPIGSTWGKQENKDEFI